MTPTKLAAVLVSMGCPPEKSGEMATQLSKRADQLTRHTGKSHGEAMAHLLGLMSQGWAAKERGR